MIALENIDVLSDNMSISQKLAISQAFALSDGVTE